MALQTIPTFSPSGYLSIVAPPPPPPSPADPNEYYGPPGRAVDPFGSLNAGATPNTAALPAGTSPDKVLIQNAGPEPCVVVLTPAAASSTGTGTKGAYKITVGDATSVAVGQAAVAAGIPQGAIVQGVNGLVVTLSRALLADLSGTVDFIVPVDLNSGILVPPMPAPPTALAYVSGGFISAQCLNWGSRSCLFVAVGV